MLLKLFKYDFKALWKIMRFYYLGLPLYAILASLLYYAFIDTHYVLVSLVMLYFFVLAISGCFILTMVLCSIRFYRNLLSDQGYLTNTLPVSKHLLLLSKIMNIICFFVMSFVISVISLLIVGLIIDRIGLIESLYFVYDLVVEIIYNANHLTLVLALSLCCNFAIAFILIIYLVLAMGGRHNRVKLLFSYLYYLAITNTLWIIVSILVTFLAFTIKIKITIDHVLLVFNALALGVCVGSYFLTIHFMNKHLNLQ